MLFKNAFEQNPALRYVYEQLQLTSNLGRHYLLELAIYTDEELLSEELDLLEQTLQIVSAEEHHSEWTHLRNNLHQINDIQSTLALLEQGKVIMDDIQLFEIKKSAILTRRIAEELDTMGCHLYPLENIDAVITLLDPEHTNIPHFYIYASYDPELTQLRAQIQQAQNQQEAEVLRFQAQQVEDRVRVQLTEQLRPAAKAMMRNLQTLAHLDLMLAKAKLAIAWQACRPKISNHTRLCKLYNPEVADTLKEKGRSFQPIDIAFENETILITGANMAGKSVLLKTVSLAQYLLQFGFFIPAQSAEMSIVDEIISSIGDRQSEISGLSSFAVEILTINKIIQTGRQGKRVLALVDELARTTNPEEGKRLVGNFIRLTEKLHITTLITTHYSGIESSCRRLRVKGLQLHENQVITPGNIHDYMDYSLVSTTSDEVPMEAFTIAKLLNVDPELCE